LPKKRRKVDSVAAPSKKKREENPHAFLEGGKGARLGRERSSLRSTLARRKKKGGRGGLLPPIEKRKREKKVKFGGKKKREWSSSSALAQLKGGRKEGKP